MGGETAAPCRHRGAPPEDVVNRVASSLQTLSTDAEFLRRNGITPEEYELVMPAAIERLRGRAAASNAERRAFLSILFEHMLNTGIITGLEAPDYGDDTVYRLRVPGVGDVAIVQKGCPDGAHSSVAWSVPDWAAETYLWWLCPSLNYEPGEHVVKGVNRLRSRFFSNEYSDAVDGIVFHNQTCGTQLRPCPKAERSITLGEMRVPPPCIWTMPARDAGPDCNWEGQRTPAFPAILLSTFGITPGDARLFTGHVGFLNRAGRIRTNISSRFGPAATTTFRS